MTSPFIDISGQVNNHDDRGLLDIALHPDFPNTPYLYLLYTYDPPQVYQNLNDELAGPDKGGNRVGRLIRVTADAATNYTTAVAGSEVVLLGTNSTWANFNAYIDSTVNITEPPGGTFLDGTYVQDFINSDSSSHTVASLMFGVDGASTCRSVMVPRTTRWIQERFAFKISTIFLASFFESTHTGLGYPNNPYQNGNLSSNRSKVYQLGLRNPFRMATNPNNGKIYIGDVGWTQWEEINSGAPGANFGWPYFEGGNGVNLRTTQYESLPQAQAFYASGQLVTPSLLGLNHAADGINAVVMGDFYTERPIREVPQQSLLQ